MLTTEELTSAKGSKGSISKGGPRLGEEDTLAAPEKRACACGTCGQGPCVRTGWQALMEAEAWPPRRPQGGCSLESLLGVQAQGCKLGPHLWWAVRGEALSGGHGQPHPRGGDARQACTIGVP